MVNGFDLAAAEWFYSIRNDYLTSVFTFITHLGDVWFITALCFLLILMPYARNNGFTWPLVAGAVTAALLQRLLKYIVKRPRPDMDMFLIEQGGYSFPSGHSMTGLVFYGFAIFLIRRKFPDRRSTKVFTCILVCLIFFLGLSRLYLGVHYVTDVLTGWALGGILLFILIKIYRCYSMS